MSSSLFAGIVVALGMTVVNTAATSLLAIDDDAFWYRNVVKRQAGRIGHARAHRRARPVLPRDRRAGPRRPAARDARRQRAQHGALGARRTRTAYCRWETDWSSQTGACQAGLLHGDNFDMPAFRWWEKDRGARDRHQPPARRDGARAPSLQRPRPALRRRREPRQHRVRRRAPQPADDEHRAAARPAGQDRPGLLRLLREPVQRAPHARARVRARW